MVQVSNLLGKYQTTSEAPFSIFAAFWSILHCGDNYLMDVTRSFMAFHMLQLPYVVSPVFLNVLTYKFVVNIYWWPLNYGHNILLKLSISSLSFHNSWNGVVYFTCVCARWGYRPPEQATYRHLWMAVWGGYGVPPLAHHRMGLVRRALAWLMGLPGPSIRTRPVWPWGVRGCACSTSTRRFRS
jgi:hypothetical protein